MDIQDQITRVLITRTWSSLVPLALPWEQKKPIKAGFRLNNNGQFYYCQVKANNPVFFQFTQVYYSIHGVFGEWNWKDRKGEIRWMWIENGDRQKHGWEMKKKRYERTMWGDDKQQREKETVEHEKKLSNAENWQIADRGRVDGSALLFQANFMGSNQSTAPDTDGAAAICWEISPLIGPTEKGHRRRTATRCCFTSQHNWLYEQLGLPINHYGDDLLRLTREHTRWTVSDYFMVLERWRMKKAETGLSLSIEQSVNLKTRVCVTET